MNFLKNNDFIGIYLFFIANYIDLLFLGRTSKIKILHYKFKYRISPFIKIIQWIILTFLSRDIGLFPILEENCKTYMKLSQNSLLLDSLESYSKED